MQVNSNISCTNTFSGKNTEIVFNRGEYNARKIKVSDILKIDEYNNNGKSFGLLEFNDYGSIRSYHTCIPVEKVLSAYMAACAAPKSLKSVDIRSIDNIG